MHDPHQDVQRSLEAPVALEAPVRLTAEQIRAAPDVREELVPVPEWGGAVLVRSLSFDAINRIRSIVEAGGGDEVDLSKRLLVESCPDLDDTAMGWLGEKNPAALKRLLTAMRVLQGISQEEVEAAAVTFPDGAGPPVRASVGGAAGVDDR